LGVGQPADLQGELEKLASPLDKKASELALECISRSQQAFHNGPAYRKVLAQWGWQTDTVKKGKVDQVVSLLGGKAPWIDPAGSPGDEKQILMQHLQKGSTPDSWYALAKIRFDHGELGLSRLTLLAALSKSPPVTGRLLNTLAVIEQMNRGEAAVLSVLYEKALTAGSGPAGANLALLHFNGGRLEPGMDALKAANTLGVFASDSAIQGAVVDLLTPPTPPPTVAPLVQQTGAGGDASQAAGGPAASPTGTGAPVAGATPAGTSAPVAAVSPTATNAPVTAASPTATNAPVAAAPPAGSEPTRQISSSPEAVASPAATPSSAASPSAPESAAATHAGGHR
jgi:hypothetical protein